MRFENRTQAGKALADALAMYRDHADALILAVSPGGVPVAVEVARANHLPLDVFLVRKLYAPGHDKVAIGAVTFGESRFINHAVVRHLQVSDAVVDTIAAEQQQELARWEKLCRGERPMPDIRDKTVILVDDGLATGTTMRAAVRALRQHGPAQIIVAVPTAAIYSCKELENQVDEVVCLSKPEPFQAVKLWYDDFPALTDDQVQALLGAYVYA